VLLAVEAGTIKEGSGALAVKAGSRSCHQGGCEFLKKAKGASTSFLNSVHGRIAGRVVMGARGIGSFDASQAGRIWVRFVLCRPIRSWFTSCLAARSGQSVGRSGSSTMPASGWAHPRWSSGGGSVAGIRYKISRHSQLPAFSGSPSFGGLEEGQSNAC